MIAKNIILNVFIILKV